MANEFLNLTNSLNSKLNQVGAQLTKSGKELQNSIGAAGRNPATGASETAISDKDQDIPQPPRPEHRVRLTAFNFQRGSFSKGGFIETIFGGFGLGEDNNINRQEHLLHPLKEHGGIMFPYTPQIVAEFQAAYGEYTPMHSITDFAAYQRTPSPTITISTQLTVQNIDEGRYALACIHFARTVTKMYFGSKSSKSGTPPPVLHLSGYGEYMFNRLPVVMTQYTIGLDADVDYVEIPITSSNSQIQNIVNSESLTNCGLVDSSTEAREQLKSMTLKAATASETGYSRAWLPTKFLFSVTLKVTRTPKQARTFDLDSFRSGELLIGGKGGNGLIESGGGWW